MIKIDYTKLSPNCNERTDTIKKITIHHMAGNLSLETCGDIFFNGRNASANYGIDSEGRVGLYVPENMRAWSCSNPENDMQAINIELANDEINGEWHVSDKALNKCIELCADICNRYKFKLIFTGDKTGTLTQHNYFEATECPGPYLKSKFKYIADEVNKRLNFSIDNDDEDHYNINVDCKFITRGSVGKWVKIWQSIIGVEVDGSFGPDTSEKTMKFQEKNGLVVDNMVGPATWQKGFKVIYND